MTKTDFTIDRWAVLDYLIIFLKIRSILISKIALNDMMNGMNKYQIFNIFNFVYQVLEIFQIFCARVGVNHWNELVTIFHNDLHLSFPASCGII